ncbi:MAG: S4 domain-containing protein [Mucinivorans sp.]
MSTGIRADKFLWSVRLYKTRSDAAEAIHSGRISISGVQIKPSREITTGDVIEIRRPPVTYSYRVKELIDKRQGAKLVPQYIDDITPAKELEKLEMAAMTTYALRDRGAGRPTKRERRELDKLQQE